MDIPQFLTWLNRVGIVLNFLAGFMLAPELIGLERLRRFENNLETTLKHFGDRVNERLDDIRNSVPLYSGKELLLALLYFIAPSVLCISSPILLLAYWGTWISFLIGFLLILSISIMIYRVLEYFKYQGWAPGSYFVNTKIGTKLTGIYVILLYVPAHVVMLAIGGLIGGLRLGGDTIVWVFLSVLNRIVKSVVLRLEGEERMRSLVVVTGIIFFIFGNLCQLIATF